MEIEELYNNAYLLGIEDFKEWIIANLEKDKNTVFE